MERINTTTGDFFKGIPESILADNEDKIAMECADISSMMSEALIVLDFQKRNCLYVSSHYLFSLDYTLQKIKEEGYEFFRIVLHPDDLPLWRNIHIAILKSLYNNKLPAERINFFGCALRLRSFLSDEDKKPDYLMAYLKIKPKFQDGIPRWGICLLSIAVVSKPGNLCVYYDNHDYSVYSFITGKWTFHSFAPLSKREKQILVWSQQGLTNQEMADKLHLTVKVVEKAKTSLFDELNLDSFSKKLQYANNRCLIYQSPHNKKDDQCKKNREIPIAGYIICI